MNKTENFVKEQLTNGRRLKIWYDLVLNGAPSIEFRDFKGEEKIEECIAFMKDNIVVDVSIYDENGKISEV